MRTLKTRRETFGQKKSFKNPALPDVDEEQLRKRFEREVVYQSRIEHLNVVKIIAYDLKAEPPFFVMELGEESLLDELTADHTLGGNPNTALFDVLSGLEAIHILGITHRDLKPGNVLKIPDEDGNFRYAISDFGLMTAAESQTTTLTKSNMGVGTTL